MLKLKQQPTSQYNNSVFTVIYIIVLFDHLAVASSKSGTRYMEFTFHARYELRNFLPIITCSHL